MARNYCPDLMVATGVSALRVTIAIANARTQRGLRKSIEKLRPLFRNESAASRRVRQALLEDPPQ